MRSRTVIAILMVSALGLGADRGPSWTEKLFHPEKVEARERARVQFAVEEAQARAVQVENQLADLQEERARLLEHLKSLLLERNRTRTEVDTLRDDLDTVTNTLAQVAEQAAHWKTEAEQRRGEASELRQQLAVVPPESPTVQKVRTTYERELRETRKDTEYLWSKEREKLERRHAAELKDVQERLAKASTQLSALTEELRQVTQHARDTEQRLLKEKADQVGHAQQETAEARERAQREQEQLARKAAQAESDNQRALAQTHERADRELEQIRRKAAQDEQDHQRALTELHQQMDTTAADLKRRLAFEHLAVRRLREDARRQINHAEQRSRQERVGLEQLRSGVVVDWAKLYVRVGVLEAQLGHTAEAERDFKYAVQLQPTLATAYYNLGILYDDHLNNGPAAIEAYEQYLLLAPEAKDAKTVRGWVQLLKGTEAANQDRADWNRPGLSGFGKTFKELWG